MKEKTTGAQIVVTMKCMEVIRGRIFFTTILVLKRAVYVGIYSRSTSGNHTEHIYNYIFY